MYQIRPKTFHLLYTLSQSLTSKETDYYFTSFAKANCSIKKIRLKELPNTRNIRNGQITTVKYFNDISHDILLKYWFWLAHTCSIQVYNKCAWKNNTSFWSRINVWCKAITWTWLVEHLVPYSCVEFYFLGAFWWCICTSRCWFVGNDPTSYFSPLLPLLGRFRLDGTTYC